MWFKSILRTPAVVAISFCFIGGTSTAPAYADLGDQLFKLLADDGAEGDSFGVSVAISGATAIVGAIGDDDNGNTSGSAYLLDTTTGRQIAKLLPEDGAEGDVFGRSVAISPDGIRAIVGAPFNQDNGLFSGSAYLFDTTTGRQLFKLLPKDNVAGDVFGRSVAISGATAIVGAIGDDDNGNTSGSAYLLDTTTGRQIAKLLPDDGAEGDVFGSSVAIGGDIAIVGAYLQDNDNGESSGSAYLFDISDPANPVQIAKLLPEDGAANDQFGFSVAISTDGIGAIVGAFKDDDNGDGSGSAYLFDTTTGRQIAKLLPDDGAADDFFGRSVAISGATAIVGAYADEDNGEFSGSAYLFDTTTGRQIAKLLPDDGAANDVFALSVAISGATAIVGAELDDANGFGSGSAYLFDAAAESITTPPDEFKTFRGFLASGGLDDLLDSDDNDLCHNPGITIFPLEAPVTLDFLGTLPNDSPASLDVTIESSANTVGLELAISFWNYNTNSWDVVGTDTQTNNVDTVRTFAGIPADHVEAGTGEVRTRYEVRVVSFIFLFPWLDCVDHVFWTITD